MPASRSCDAIVIGAGYAGLRAARDLRAAGLDVVILEGRDRIGGRAYTRPFKGTDQLIDLGGSWVVPEYQPHVAEEIERYGLPLVHSPEAQNYRTNVGGQRLTGLAPVPPQDFAEMERALYLLISASQRLDFGQPYDQQPIADLDVSFTDLLKPHQLPATVVEYLNTWMPGSHPDEATALGFLSWMAGFGNSAWNLFASIDRKFDGGTRVLADALAEDAGADLRLSTAVDEITIAEDGSLAVLARTGEAFSAPAGVLAVPLNTWKSIAFRPGLSGLKAEIAQAGHIGAGHKLWVHLEGAPDGLVGIGKGIGLNWLFEEYEAEPGSLHVAFAGPYPSGSTVDPTDRAAIQQAVEFFAPDAKVLDVDFHDWNEDEFSQGTWITHRPGAMSKYHSSLRTPEGGLFFAGTDVSYGWGAWFEGALETGADAARRVLARAGHEASVSS